MKQFDIRIDTIFGILHFVNDTAQEKNQQKNATLVKYCWWLATATWIICTEFSVALGCKFSQSFFAIPSDIRNLFFAILSGRSGI